MTVLLVLQYQICITLSHVIVGTVVTRPSPPLEDIVLGFSFRASLQGFKTCLLGRGFRFPYLCKECQCFVLFLQPMWDLTIHLSSGPASSLVHVPFSNRCGTLNPLPLGAQCPCWHTASCSLPSGLRLLVGTSPGVWL